MRPVAGPVKRRAKSPRLRFVCGTTKRHKMHSNGRTVKPHRAFTCGSAFDNNPGPDTRRPSANDAGLGAIAGDVGSGLLNLSCRRGLQ
jgi:hypothetical protein